MRASYLSCAALMVSALAHAGQDETVAVEPGQAIVQVHGIVCSFCAYGTEKNLSELKFLDKSQFGGDGVLIDIQTHRVTLALLADQPFDVSLIYSAIKKGGYDPVAFYLNLHGELRKVGDRYLLTAVDSGQVFEILGSAADQFVDRGLVTVTGRVDANRVSAITRGQPIPVILDVDS